MLPISQQQLIREVLYCVHFLGGEAEADGG